MAYRNGNPVKLNEVARVYDGVDNDRWSSWYGDVAGGQKDLERSIFLSVFKQPGTTAAANGTSSTAISPAASAAGITGVTTVLQGVDVSLFHPVLAAKQMATVDHIGGGRFGLNIVCGWYEDEFRMFGRCHVDAYAIPSLEVPLKSAANSFPEPGRPAAPRRPRRACSRSSACSPA